MRLIAVLLSAGLVAASFGQQPGNQPPPPPRPQPGQPATPPPPPRPQPDQPATPATPAQPRTPDLDAAQPEQPPKPQPIPVPEGPVVNRQELEGGLVVEDLKIGDGYEVKPGGAVVALYHGTVKETGKVFDSAFDRGTPVAFPLTGVIQGWQNGVPGMKVGGVRRLIIPAALAYGASSPSPDIPANADLVFVIQLVDALAVEDIKEGEGEAVEGQFVAVTAHTIKDPEGKVVDQATAENPYIWIPRELQALDLGLVGMKPGGKRKLHIPKEMNQVSSPMANPAIPSNVALEMEVELIANRNLKPRR